MFFTTSIAIAAGVCLAFAVLYFMLASLSVRLRTRSFLFALFAATYGGAILFARSAYLADSLDAFLLPYQWSLFVGYFGFIAFIWYVGAYTMIRPHGLLWGLSGTFVTMALAAIFLPELLLDTSDVASLQTLPWGETVYTVNLGSAVLSPLLLLAAIATILYVTVAGVLQFRRGERAEALPLAIGIGWFVASFVAEILVTFGIIDFIVLGDFGFFGFLLAMSFQESKKRVEAERSLLEYQHNLQNMVADRTRELEAIQAELVVQAKDRAVTEERNRIARELHDAVTQLLFSINLIAGSLPVLVRRDVDAAKRAVRELQRLTRGALAEMRTLLQELRPNTITNTELPRLVGQLTDGLAARHDIPVDVHLDLAAALPPAVHLAVYRIAQEALNNVAKHSNASHIDVKLTGDNRHVHLSVEDDGYGFDPSDIQGSRMGLEIMRERASGIGGRVAVVSKPHTGTTVELFWNANSHG
jgi:signal transduction histidine kinase